MTTTPTGKKISDFSRTAIAGKSPVPEPRIRPLKSGEFIENDGSDNRYEKGSISTERLITWQLPSGKWVNTPSIFMRADGKPIVLTDEPDVAQKAASMLMRAGYSFPTFESLEEAIGAAKLRSAKGGASQEPLATR